MANRQDVAMRLGEHWIFEVACSGPGGAAFVSPIASARFRLASKQSLLADKTVGAGGGVVVTGSQVVATITPTEQAGWAPGAYRYDVQVTLQDGTVSDQAFGTVTVTGTLYTEFP